MKKEFVNLVEKNKILESSLSRIWSLVQKRIPFAIISLSRGNMNEKEKDRAFLILKEETRKLKYGFTEMKGGYVEQGTDNIPDKEVVEYSLFIPNITKEHAIQLGQIDLDYGPQDVVLFCDGKNFLGYIITNPSIGKVGDIELEFNYGKDKNALPMAKEAVKKYFSMLKKGSHRGKKFSFIPKTSSSFEENFKLYEMRDKRIPKYPEQDWWYNFGVRIL